MKNFTLNLKIQFILLSAIIVYFLVYFLVISPKIKNFIIENEKKHYEMELDKIMHIIDYQIKFIKKAKKELQNLKDFEKLKKEEINKIYSLLKEIKINDTGYILLVDKQNKKYVHPNNKYDNKNIDIFYKINEKNLIEVLEESYKNNTPLEYKWTMKNESKLYDKIAWVEYNEYFKWYIISAALKKDLEKNFLQINSKIITLSLTAFLVIYIITLNFIRNITFPLNNLLLNIKAFKKGDYSKESFIDISSNDEFEIINQNFLEMKDVITDNINHLEKKVEHRTKQLKTRLYFDEQTKLKNKLSLIDDIKKIEFCSIILININKFNEMNELYGHRIGNLLIKQISSNLKKIAQKYDLKLYRIEGVKFVFLKEGHINFEKFCKKVLRYQNRINTKSMFLKQIKEHIYIDTTLGISICQEQALKSAFTALNSAKRNNLSYCIFNHGIDEKKLIQKNNYWNKKIKAAIFYGRIIPFFQAIVNKDKQIIKLEALMRMKDIENNQEVFHTPYKFLEISKKTRQYELLSFIIICEVLKMLEDSNYPISINMSYSDTQDEKIRACLNKYLKNRKIANKLTIEILEDDKILDYEKLREFISYYKDLGVKFAIDDFGSGYSNLLNIIKLKADFIKIDGSIIKDIHIDDTSFKLVKSIVKFAQEMQIDVIAEFVHNEIVFEKLKTLNIYGYQGFHFYEPNTFCSYK